MINDARILVVDDNKENLRLAGSILKENGYKIAVVLNGASAIKILEKNDFDLVLLDVMMPGIDGFEVCRRIKSNQKLKEIPIIFLTAKNQSEYIVNGFKAGGVDYVSKPFNKEELLARVGVHVKLKQSIADLLKLNDQKDKFFSIMAHDLRSPFSSIIGFSELLEEQVKQKKYAEIEQYANIINLSSHRAIDLLTNLIEWARFQIGRMEFNPEYIEMNDLVKGIILLFDVVAGQKNISIINNCISENASVFADKEMLKTVLRNLISNAIKFTMPGGKIIVNIECKPEVLTVSIKDNGVGMPQSVFDKLFKIDGVCSTSGTNKEKGTGLGLILCKEFIEKHHGTVWVESEEGKGSKFSFSIPRNPETE